MNSERERIADYYKSQLGDIKELNFIENTANSKTNWHLFGILVPPERRYWIMDALRAEGVMANVHYTPLHRNRFYKEHAFKNEMQGSSNFFSRLLRLPIYPSLSQEERFKVVEALRKVMKCISEC